MPRTIHERVRARQPGEGQRDDDASTCAADDIGGDGGQDWFLNGKGDKLNRDGGEVATRAPVVAGPRVPIDWDKGPKQELRSLASRSWGYVPTWYVMKPRKG